MLREIGHRNFMACVSVNGVFLRNERVYREARLLQHDIAPNSAYLLTKETSLLKIKTSNEEHQKCNLD
jgi:hypothetical protein